jgi:ABC-2 type transport system permease protein
MNGRIIRAIAVKDWQEVRQNRMAWSPVLILPFIFCVFLPLLIILLPQVVPDAKSMSADDLALLTRGAPPFLQEQLKGMSDNQVVILLLLGYTLAPLFLIMPLMTSSVIGADSFAGEKERKTMEALLYTSATERELFFGKVVAALVPAVGITWGSFVIYTLILDVFGGRVMQRVWFPTPPWWPLILWVTPAIAVAGIMAAVIISARVNSFMAAYQTSSALVLPLVILVVGQIGGLVFLGVEVMLVLGFILWVVDGALLWLVLKLFSRARLMGATSV